MPGHPGETMAIPLVTSWLLSRSVPVGYTQPQDGCPGTVSSVGAPASPSAGGPRTVLRFAIEADVRGGEVRRLEPRMASRGDAGRWAFWSEALVTTLRGLAAAEVRRSRGATLDPEDIVQDCCLRLRELAPDGRLAADPAFARGGALRMLVRNVVHEGRRRELGPRGTKWYPIPQASDLGATDAESLGEPVARPISDAERVSSVRPHVSDGASAAAVLRDMVSRLSPAPTPTQLQVLALRSKGLSFRVIGSQLGRDPSSLRERLTRLLARLSSHAGRRSDRVSMPPAPARFFVDRSARWRRVYLAWSRGLTRADIARQERVTPAAAGALIRRVRQAIEAAESYPPLYHLKGAVED